MFDREQIIARTRAYFNPTGGAEPSDKAKAIDAIITKHKSNFGCLTGPVREIVELVLGEKLPTAGADTPQRGVAYVLTTGASAGGVRLMVGLPDQTPQPINERGGQVATVTREQMREPTVEQIDAFLAELKTRL